MKSIMKIDDPLPLTITRKWLDQHGACKDQADLFERIWPEGVAVTEEALVDAAKVGLNLDWLAERVLLLSVYDEYLAKYALLYVDFQLERNALLPCSGSKIVSLAADYQAKCNTLLIGVLWPVYEKGARHHEE